MKNNEMDPAWMFDKKPCDNGEVRRYEGGGVRDSNKGKPRYDLIPSVALKRMAELYRKGAEHYGEHNWEKGITRDSFVESAWRHWMAYLLGETNEDHLASLVFNVFGIMYLQDKEGKKEIKPIGEQRSYTMRIKSHYLKHMGEDTDDK